MTRIRVCSLSLLFLFIVDSFVVLAAAESTAAIATNDNRLPAGELHDGVQTIHLEIGEGLWRPGSDDGEALSIYAIGEAGRPLQIPGPLIRVQQGTEIRAIVHNSLPATVTLHGLHQKPGDDKDVLVVRAGETTEKRFQAGDPGTYFYWASTTGNLMVTRTTIETELEGAFIIDPRGALPNDRVFVLGVWFSPAYRAIVQDPNYREIPTINGKLWPYTERFTFHVGDTIHWRWVNPTVTGHAMHLHGFYFSLDAVGNSETDRRYSDGEKRREVTHDIADPGTFDMTWTAERAGRWLMHCHMLEHMVAVHSPTPTPFAPLNHGATHVHGSEAEDAGMSGMVLGITILPDKEAAQSPAWKAQRRLQLIIDERKNGRPFYALTVRDLGDAPSPSSSAVSGPLLGPPIVLTRGQPVEIEVVNHLKQPTAIHWHGIELESYYDGVPGWTGNSSQVTPAIPPGKSFVARMVPPKAGTFIYHTHYHDVDQLKNGIYGPLIVMPPGQQYDPTYDKTFVIAMGSFEPFGDMLVINGNPQPPQMPLKPQARYRFRFINITPDEPGIQLRMLQAYNPVQWRLIAKDGVDVSPVMQKADMLISVGETYDFEYEANGRGDVVIDVFHPRARVRTTQNLVFGPRTTGIPEK